MGNQYFQLLNKGGNAYLHFFPATNGGTKLVIGEVTSYLESRNYSDYNLKELNLALQRFGQETEVCVGIWDGITVSETMSLKVSLDKMRVICRFYPPSPGGRLMDAKEIVGSLNYQKIRFGVNQQAIYDFMQERKYCTDYIFAKGQEPIHGKDAKIEYFFNTNINLQPKRNEDGSVDYKELNTISHVKQGELLARLIKEDPGKSGKNVFGEEVRPRTVKTEKLSYGNNISINEEKTEIYSDVTGHVNFINNKVFVSNVFEVPADVDNSVGNIDYQGSVHIRGNVKSGFIVRATGDVIVEGFAEGAHIESGGQIVIKHGIHGMYKGFFSAGTNLMAKYIENATVVTGGYVEAEMILNSDVSALNSIRVKGKKGLITGGVVRASDCVEAEYIGNEMGTTTVIEVGIEPEKKARYIDISKELATLTKEMEETKLILANYTAIIKKGEHLPKDKLAYVQKLAVQFKQMQEKSEILKEEKKVIYMEMIKSDHSYVAVSRNVYPGVSVSISDLSYQVKDVRSFCKFKKQDGIVCPVSL